MTVLPSCPSCSFCPHPEHPGQRCTACKCKGKRGLFGRLIDAIGKALGEAKFGD